MTVRRIVVATAIVLVAAASGAAQSRGPGHAFSPARRPATDEQVHRLTAPAGFHVDVFRRSLGHPRMMAVGDDGTVYVTRPATDDVVALRPGGGVDTVLANLDRAHGITLHDGSLYVAGARKVVAAELRGGRLDGWRTLIDDLPDGDGHDRRTIGFGPDGMLYISIGSTCNVCRETNAEFATIVRARADGRQRTIFARGLRNTMAFGWHPDTREMWGMDNGADWRGDDDPPEELNRLVEGGDYGWPDCIGDRHPDPEMHASAERCAKTLGPTLGYTAHAAPISMLFYAGEQFPREYRGDLFVAFHGSWNRQPPSGYRVVRVRFEHGRPVRFEDFVAGFLLDDGHAQFGRPAGLAMARDGALLVSDDENGVIYRITYTGSH